MIVLVKSYHWLHGERHAQLTCWNCHLPIGVVGMAELQKMTCQPGLPVVCSDCEKTRKSIQNAQQLTLIDLPVPRDY